MPYVKDINFCVRTVIFTSLFNINWLLNIFMYLNGIIGFAPVKDDDLEAEA